MSPEGAQEFGCPQCGAPMADGANFCGVCGTDLLTLQPNTDSHEGLTIGGRYVVGAKIGSGGMGEVYLAEHKQLGQKVAIKFLPKAMTGDERLVKRFYNEARNTGRVSHPNAVSLNDFGQTEDGILYIIMEYIEGEDLATIVAQKGRLDLATILHIMLQLCDVLHIAHKEGVVHRDLKPDNIMLTEGRGGRYSVKVLDFGIARLIGDAETAMTERGLVYGTPEFMSPEQALGQDVDGRADLYSLGIMIYYLLCGGHIPFFDDDRRKILSKQVNAPAPRPSRQCPDNDIPPCIETIVMKALEKDPDDRYASIADFADAIEQAISELRDAGFFKDAAPTFADMLSLTSQGTNAVGRADDMDTVPVSDLEQAAYMAPSDLPRAASSSDSWSTGFGQLPNIGPSERFMMISPDVEEFEGEMDLDFSGEIPSIPRRPKRSSGADPMFIGVVVIGVLVLVALAVWGLWPGRGENVVPDADIGVSDAGSDVESTKGRVDVASAAVVDASVDVEAAKPAEPIKKKAAKAPVEKMAPVRAKRVPPKKPVRAKKPAGAQPPARLD